MGGDNRGVVQEVSRPLSGSPGNSRTRTVLKNNLCRRVDVEDESGARRPAWCDEGVVYVGGVGAAVVDEDEGVEDEVEDDDDRLGAQWGAAGTIRLGHNPTSPLPPARWLAAVTGGRFGLVWVKIMGIASIF